MNWGFDFEKYEMLMWTPPCWWRHVANVDGAKVENDGVAFVQQIPICCRHAAGVDSDTIAGGERFSAESGISEIKEMVVFCPVKDDKLSVTLHRT